MMRCVCECRGVQCDFYRVSISWMCGAGSDGNERGLRGEGVTPSRRIRRLGRQMIR